MRTKPWPRWPVADEDTLRQVQDVLENGRWAISGPHTGHVTKEQQFSSLFAAYNNVDYCVTMDHGTSALIAALEALDVGFGDEVIVPGMTWVAPAIAVLSVNAVPIIVDVEKDTFCIDPGQVQKAITPRTKAIIAIHMYGSMANMDALTKIADEYGLLIVEDAAHSHGSEWRGQKAGTFGDIGVFSMQQGKVLTCGEGGAAITKNAEWKARMENSAWNARMRMPSDSTRIGSMQLVEGLPRFGTNRCLSEFQAAILIDQLSRLDDQNNLRERNARILDEALSVIPGIVTMRRQPNVNKRTYYGYLFRVHSDDYGMTAAELVERLQPILGMGDFLLHPVYKPLYRNPLYMPHPSRHRFGEDYLTAVRPNLMQLPNCEYAYSTAVVFHHSVLLGNAADMQEIIAAVEMLRSKK